MAITRTRGDKTFLEVTDDKEKITRWTKADVAAKTRASDLPAVVTPGRKGLTPAMHTRLKAFIADLAMDGNITRAVRETGVARATVYRLRAQDELFRNAMNRAQEIGAEGLLDEAKRRAYHGTDEPRFNAEGEEIGRITKYSDTLLIFLLKGLMPDTFRERHTHAVAVGGEVDLNVKVSPAVERLIHNTTHQIIEQ